jgi:hypothetical protein
MTPADRDDTRMWAVEYDRLATHYEQESVKLRERSRRRTEQIELKAAQQGEATPYLTVDPASVAYSWAGDDPKLKEYNAGINIVERRATMYAGMAASLKLTLLLDALADGINISGSFTKPPTR